MLPVSSTLEVIAMDTVWPLPPAAPASTAVVEARSGANPALLGLLIGAAVPALVASIAWWLNQPYVAAVAGVGIVVGAAIGAAVGPRMAGPSWVGSTILAAMVAPLIPGVVIAVLLVFGSAASAIGTGFLDAAGGLFFGIVYGFLVLVVAELAGAPVTLPVAFVVAFLVRRAARMRPERAAFHVGLLVVFALAAGVVTLVATTGAFGAVGALESIQVHALTTPRCGGTLAACVAAFASSAEATRPGTATTGEAEAAALQYVRKISGFRAPSAQQRARVPARGRGHRRDHGTTAPGDRHAGRRRAPIPSRIR